MYFDQSISLHGTYWHDLFGYRQSHGCVNMTISDAKYMFDWMQNAKTTIDHPASSNDSQATQAATDSDPYKVQLDDKGQPTFFVDVYASGKYGGGVLRQ
jgi:hypothetical protein